MANSLSFPTWVDALFQSQNDTCVAGPVPFYMRNNVRDDLMGGRINLPQLDDHNTKMIEILKILLYDIRHDVTCAQHCLIATLNEQTRFAGQQFLTKLRNKSLSSKIWIKFMLMVNQFIPELRKEDYILIDMKYITALLYMTGLGCEQDLDEAKRLLDYIMDHTKQDKLIYMTFFSHVCSLLMKRHPSTDLLYFRTCHIRESAEILALYCNDASLLKRLPHCQWTNRTLYYSAMLSDKNLVYSEKNAREGYCDAQYEYTRCLVTNILKTNRSSDLNVLVNTAKEKWPHAIYYLMLLVICSHKDISDPLIQECIQEEIDFHEIWPVEPFMIDEDCKFEGLEVLNAAIGGAEPVKVMSEALLHNYHRLSGVKCCIPSDDQTEMMDPSPCNLEQFLSMYQTAGNKLFVPLLKQLSSHKKAPPLDAPRIAEFSRNVDCNGNIMWCECTFSQDFFFEYDEFFWMF